MRIRTLQDKLKMADEKFNKTHREAQDFIETQNELEEIEQNDLFSGLNNKIETKV